jgi:hypothetical protein
MRMSRATLQMERSIFGLGLFLGAVLIRHGFDQGCVRAELLAINDTPLYHSKVIQSGKTCTRSLCLFSCLYGNTEFVCGSACEVLQENGF